MSSFNELINDSRPVLVDFFATWCGPCKIQAPMLEDLKRRLGEQVKIIKIDVDRNPVVATRYHIRSVPTLVIFRNGEIKWRQSGVFSADELEQVLSAIDGLGKTT